MRCAFYPGSFDPPTLGHRDIISRGLGIFDRLVIGIGVHPAKAPMFSEDDRAAMLAEELAGLGASARGEVVLFQDLTVAAAAKHGAKFILRGLRNNGDFDYEMQLAGMNKQLAADIETVFLSASPGTAHITSTLVRQIARLGGDVSPFLSPAVLRRVKHNLKLA